MKPAFALSLSSDRIVLLHRAEDGWRSVASTPFNTADLPAALAAMREDALRLAPDGITCKLILPADQIRYLTAETGDLPAGARLAAARQALDGATPYAVDELAFDISPDGSRTHIAAVARETLDEAEAFATEHGLGPVSFAGAPGSSGFQGEPFFGTTRASGGTKVEPDSAAVKVIGPAILPDTATKKAPEDSTPNPAKDTAAQAQTPPAVAPQPGGAAPKAAIQTKAKAVPSAPRQQKPREIAAENAPAAAGPVLTPAKLRPAPLSPAKTDDVPAPAAGILFNRRSSLTPPASKTATLARKIAPPAPAPVAAQAAKPASVPLTAGRQAAAVPVAAKPLGAAARATATSTAVAEGKLPEDKTGQSAPPPVIPPAPAALREPTSAAAVLREASPAAAALPAAAADNLAATQGKPRYLGAGLTASLLLFMAAVAGWSLFSSGEGFFAPPPADGQSQPPAPITSAAEQPAEEPVNSPSIPAAAPEPATAAEQPAEEPVSSPGIPATAPEPATAAEQPAEEPVSSPGISATAPEPATAAEQPAEEPVSGPGIPATAPEPATAEERPAIAAQVSVLPGQPDPGLQEIGPTPAEDEPATQAALAGADEASLQSSVEDEAAADGVELLEDHTKTVLLDPAAQQPGSAENALPAPDPAAAAGAGAEPVDELIQAARYAATGIWPFTPGLEAPPAVPELDGFYAASIDRSSIAADAVALPQPVSFAQDKELGAFASPAASVAAFDLDGRGLVEASPEGTLNPDGIMVYLGRPEAVPPRAPERNDPAAEALAEEAARNQVLSRKRPKARPADLEEQAERAQLGGLSRAELASLRPRQRPASLKPAEEAQLPVTAQAVATSVQPRKRPTNFANLVDRARHNSQNQAPAAAAVPAAAAAAAPPIPTSASVARRATTGNAINLRKLNLIGVYGTASDRRALVRLPSGRYKKVQVGDRIDGGRVIAIGESQLQYQKGGRNRTLTMPNG